MNLTRGVIQDNFSIFKDRLLYQHKTAENIKKLGLVWGTNQDDLQQLFYDSIYLFLWENAQGSQLDILGKIIGFERNGRTDDNYKTLLKFVIRLNMSAGQIPVFLDAIEQIFDAERILYHQSYDISNIWPVAQIFTDGKLNLYTTVDIKKQDGSLFVKKQLGLNQWKTKSGNSVVKKDYTSIVVNSTQEGGQIIAMKPDDLDETILYKALPAGVGLKFLSEWVKIDGSKIIKKDGSGILV